VIREQIIIQVINKNKDNTSKDNTSKDTRSNEYNSKYSRSDVKTNVGPTIIDDEINNMLSIGVLFQPLTNHNSPIGIATNIRPILSMMDYTFKSVDDIINNVINNNAHLQHGSHIDLNIMRTIIRMEMCGYIEIREVMNVVNTNHNAYIHNNMVTVEACLSPIITLVD